MKANLERVISVTEENAVMEGTTIVNTIYDRQGYRVSYISMGRGTFMSPERFRTPALIYVMKGRLKVSSGSKENRHEAIVNAGQEYYRPANEYAGYAADDQDVIFAEMILRTDSEISMRMIPHLVQDAIHLVHYEPGQVSRSHLVNDEFFQLNMLAFSESERKDVLTDKILLLRCMEGNVTIVHENEKHLVTQGMIFIMPKGYSSTLHVSARTKISVLYLTEGENFLL